MIITPHVAHDRFGLIMLEIAMPGINRIISGSDHHLATSQVFLRRCDGVVVPTSYVAWIDHGPGKHHQAQDPAALTELIGNSLETFLRHLPQGSTDKDCWLKCIFFGRGVLVSNQTVVAELRAHDPQAVLPAALHRQALTLVLPEMDSLSRHEQIAIHEVAQRVAGRHLVELKTHLPAGFALDLDPAWPNRKTDRE